MRDGKPLDRELQKRVALIPPEEWERNDPAHIAKLIREIEEDWQAEQSAPSLSAPQASAPDTQTVKAHLRSNAPTLALQLHALRDLAEAEAKRLRESNAIDLDPDTRDELIRAFGQLIQAAEKISALLLAGNDLTDAEAEEIAGWGTVLLEEAKHWNREAKKFVARKPADPTVVTGCRVALAALIAGPLALMGAPAFASIAGSYILFQHKLSDMPERLAKTFGKGTPPT